MRIAHVSTSDSAGGAARLTYRLHRALVEAGVDSRLFVSHKLTDDSTVHETTPWRFANLRRLLRERFDELPLRFYPQRVPDFSLNWLPGDAWRPIAAWQPDVVHLHWINHGYFPVNALRRLGTPLVWSLLDHWPFTGGCHYAGECRGFESACGRCPALGSSRESDLSTKRLRAKRDAWRDLRFQLVCVSQQTAAQAQRSALFAAHPSTVLPPPVDTRVFRPVPRVEARRVLGLDDDAFIIAFGATQVGVPRKGFELARTAVASLDATGPLAKTVLCTFGNWPDPAGANARCGKIPVRHLGQLRDELSVALVFSAADVSLVPSREDTGPLIMAEALACGCPVVGFPVGANADLIRSRENGFLATPFEPASLAEGLRWAASRRGDESLRAAARATAVQHADAAGQVPRLLEVYRRACDGK